MGGNKDWVPATVDKFDTFQKKFCTDVDANAVDWNIDSDKNDILQEYKLIYDDFYAVSSIKRRANKNDYDSTDKARKDLKKYIRIFTKEEIKYNTSMTDINRNDIGVPFANKVAKVAPVSSISPTLRYIHISHLLGKYFLPLRKNQKVRAFTR
jgi:hypothetical protein